MAAAAAATGRLTDVRRLLAGHRPRHRAEVADAVLRAVARERLREAAAARVRDLLHRHVSVGT
jgi:hypothetical protein